MIFAHIHEDRDDDKLLRVQESAQILSLSRSLTLSLSLALSLSLSLSLILHLPILLHQCIGLDDLVAAMNLHSFT